MLTDDQRKLLEDKVYVWTQNATTGNMELRDYNRRCAEALTSALASKGEALPVVSEEMVTAGARAILRVQAGDGVYSSVTLARAALEAALGGRPCTCHPGDNPPAPCAGKFALSECLPRPASDKGEEAPVGEAGSMPGTDGFTMAAFRAVDVPIGTKLYARPVPGVSREEVATLPREQSLLDALTTIRDDYRINHTSKFAHGIAAGALEVHGTWFATSSQREGE